MKRKLPKIVSAPEAESLFRALDDGSERGTRDRLAFELMYRAGLRVSEVVKLYPRDVERDGVVRTYDAKGGDGTAYFDPESILPLLDRWLAIREAWAPPDGSRLFVKPAGAPLTTRYLQRRVKALKARLGIHGVLTPHVLRHTYATELLEEGFTLTEVQSALRHAHLATTSIYLHVRDESLRRKMTQRRRGKEVPDE